MYSICTEKCFLFSVMDIALCCINCKTLFNYLWHPITDAAIVFLVFVYFKDLRKTTYWLHLVAVDGCNIIIKLVVLMVITIPSHIIV